MADKGPSDDRYVTTSHEVVRPDGSVFTTTTLTVKGKHHTRSSSYQTLVGAPKKAPFSVGVGRWLTGSIFKLFIVLLLFCMCLRVLNGRSVPTFTDLLELLSHAPVISSDWLSIFSPSWLENMPWEGVWIIPKFLLTLIFNIVGFGSSVSIIGINLLLYFGYFMGWLFL